MATEGEYMAAASLPRDQRTPAQQQLVNKGISSGMQSVKNADFNANK